MEINVVLELAFSEFGPSELHGACALKRLLTVANDFEDGKWRHEHFQSFVWNNIGETALSERERRALAGRHHSALEQAVKNLRLTDSSNDPSRGSEIAEIVLYGIMRKHFGALSVVPKIFYKQNRQDNAKGADSVHIVVDESDFTIWFGEAKFYSSIDDARLSAVISSVEEALGSDKLRKENAIITNLSDLDELEIGPDLRERIKQSLSPDTSLDALKPRLCVPILLLHECALTRDASEWSDSYVDDLCQFHIERAVAYFSRQVASLEHKITRYREISFQLILFPVPNKAEVISRFERHAKHYRGE